MFFEENVVVVFLHDISVLLGCVSLGEGRSGGVVVGVDVHIMSLHRVRWGLTNSSPQVLYDFRFPWPESPWCQVHVVIDNIRSSTTMSVVLSPCSQSSSIC